MVNRKKNEFGNTLERKEKTKILFVCLGNICRSPMAEGVMLRILAEAGVLDRYTIDSAGTYAGHQGELPDARMRRHASERGYHLTHRSRPVRTEDFYDFDLLVAMDDNNYHDLQALAPSPTEAQKIVRMAQYLTRHPDTHIPDPYYGGSAGFTHVIDLLEDACQELFERVG